MNEHISAEFPDHSPKTAAFLPLTQLSAPPPCPSRAACTSRYCEDRH